MDNTRLFLVIALSFVSLMLWDAWQRDYHSAEPAPSEVGAPSPSEAPDITLPAATEAPKPSTTSLAFEPSAESLDVVSVTTDLLDIDINLTGGGITRAELSRYPIELDHPDKSFALFAQTDARSLFIKVASRAPLTHQIIAPATPQMLPLTA